jgi:hypothetical protein
MEDWYKEVADTLRRDDIEVRKKDILAFWDRSLGI